MDDKKHQCVSSFCVTEKTNPLPCGGSCPYEMFITDGEGKIAVLSVQKRVSVRPGKEELRFRRDSEFRELYEKTAFPVL